MAVRHQFKRNNARYLLADIPWPVAVIGLVFTVLPLFISSGNLIDLLTDIFILGIFAMSYDILLGYTGIVSFGHVLFFGSGSYLVGLIIKHTHPTWGYLLLAIVVTVLSSLLISLVIGYLSLRVKDVYYAMITMAFSELFLIIAEKWRSVTSGDDGFSFGVPSGLDHKIVLYYIVFVLTVITVVFLSRFISSPTGRVIMAIRENEKRAEFLGYNIFNFKLISTIVAGVVASLAGVAWALQQQFVSPGVMAVDRTIGALLMTTIGGSGTLYGAFIGSALINFAQNWLPDLADINSIFSHWYIIFGLLYIFIVLFFPRGVLGAFKRQGKEKN